MSINKTYINFSKIDTPSLNAANINADNGNFSSTLSADLISSTVVDTLNLKATTANISDVKSTTISTDTISGILDAESMKNSLTAEAIQEVVPMSWGVYDGVPPSTKNEYAIAIGNRSQSGSDAVTLGYGSVSGSYGVSVGAAISAYNVAYSTLCGYKTKTLSSATVTVGSNFRDAEGSYTCTTEGTGSITIGAGANTLNTTASDGTVTESSNAVTIGCKASNTGADSVVIGAQSSNAGAMGVVIGAGANSAHQSVTIVGNYSKSTHGGASILGWRSVAGLAAVSLGNECVASDYSVALGHKAKSKNESLAAGVLTQTTAKYSAAIGYGAKAADWGAVVFRSTAEDGTYTQLYFSGANTPLANTYEGGEAMMGYVVTDKDGNTLAAGTNKLSALFPNNSTFAPATTDENGEVIQPTVFHPSDLDLPNEESDEPEEYTPLPIYPIVEPEIG